MYVLPPFLFGSNTAHSRGNRYMSIATKSYLVTLKLYSSIHNIGPLPVPICTPHFPFPIHPSPPSSFPLLARRLTLAFVMDLGMAAQREDQSSTGSRASRREERRAISSCHAQAPYLVGQETGLPLVKCPHCNLTRVIELRIMLETRNKGMSFIKCPRNGVSEAFLLTVVNHCMHNLCVNCCSSNFLQNPKFCGYYKFQKEYLDDLIDKVVVIMCEELEDLEEGIEGSEPAIDDEGMKDLEKNLDHLMWKMNLVFVCVGIVLLSVVVKYLM